MIKLVVAWSILCVACTTQTYTLNAQPTNQLDEGEAPLPQPVTRLSLECPPGWQSHYDPAKNVLVLENELGAKLSVSIWPIEQATPFQKIMQIWTELTEREEAGEPIAPGQPFEQIVEGTKIMILMSVKTGSDGERLTILNATYASSDPQLGILIAGSWPENQNGRMYVVLAKIARSIKVVTD